MVLGTILTVLLVVVLVLGAYAAACFLVLFYLDLPGHSPFGYLTDMVYLLTIPFIFAVAVLTVLYQRYPILRRPRTA